jgi:hypothetical protein
MKKKRQLIATIVAIVLAVAMIIPPVLAYIVR